MLVRGAPTCLIAAVGFILAGVTDARAEEASQGRAGAAKPDAAVFRPTPVTVVPVLRLGTALWGSIGGAAVVNFDSGGCGHPAFARGLLLRPEIGIRGVKTDVGVGAVLFGGCTGSSPFVSFLPGTAGFSLAASWVHWWSQQQPDLVLTPTRYSTADLFGGTFALALLAGFEVGLYTEPHGRMTVLTLALTYGL